jgi:hypothetical protein
MDILVKAVEALWQVLVVGLLLGAGLPALFALGLRSLNTGRTVTAGAGGYGSPTESSKPSPLGLTGAIICFTILIAAVIFGIIVIIFGKQLFG